MTRRNMFAASTLAVALALVAPVTGGQDVTVDKIDKITDELPPQGAQIFTLPAVQLSVFLDEVLDITVDDHGIKLGGIGSDLWPDEDEGTYWMTTDRGPNGQIRVPPVTGANRRTFPIPEFTPIILKVRTRRGRIDILRAIPVVDGNNVPVTGLPNLPPPYDEQPYDCTALNTNPPFANPAGLDVEGLVRTRDGDFWLADEYSPSILRVDRQGRVRARYVPLNLALPAVNYGVFGYLPEIYKKRKVNRGFEGLALSVAPNRDSDFDGGPLSHGRRDLLYIALQSPLLNPTTAIGNASRNTRILAFDVDRETPVAEYVYRFQDVSEFGDDDPTEMKVSGLAMVDRWRMLVLERTDLVAKIYLVDLRHATNILGTMWDLASTSPSLESLDETGLIASGVAVLPKQLVVELDSADGYPQKIEGIAVLDHRTLAIANDNDFGIGTFNTAGPCTLNDSGIQSQIRILRLNRSIRSATVGG